MISVYRDLQSMYNNLFCLYQKNKKFDSKFVPYISCLFTLFIETEIVNTI